MRIFRECDVRGVVGTQVDATVAHAIGRAVGTMRRGGVIVVGGDARTSTPALRSALIEGLRRTPTRVIDVGEVATPVLYHAVAATGADAGVMVTASHNPAHHNGFKFTWGATPVAPEDIAALAASIATGAFARGLGAYERRDATEGYLRATRDRIASTRGVRIVVDGGHGVGGAIAAPLLRSLGHTVIELHTQPDGRFPERSPDPTAAGALAALQREVRVARAEFGVAFDGDGDRAVFVGPDGSILAAEAIVLLLARGRVAAGDAVVVDAKASSAIEEGIGAMGGRVVRARTGHAFIRAAFLSERARLAGEVSGHYWFEEVGVDDAPYAAALVADAVAREHRKLSDVVAALPQRSVTPDVRVPWPGEARDALLARLSDAFADRPIDRLDGVRIVFPEGWVLARKSVTEEVVTIRIEAHDDAGIDALRSALRTAAPELGSAHPFFAR